MLPFLMRMAVLLSYIGTVMSDMMIFIQVNIFLLAFSNMNRALARWGME